MRAFLPIYWAFFRYLGDGFVMAALYGEAANVDWCCNVMAARSININ
jgi:hypothetical protein